jgi:hypothetical protein
MWGETAVCDAGCVNFKDKLVQLVQTQLAAATTNKVAQGAARTRKASLRTPKVSIGGTQNCAF